MYPSLITYHTNHILAAYLRVPREQSLIEDKRRFCLNLSKSLKSPQPEVLDQSILSSLDKLVFPVQVSVYWKKGGLNWARWTKRTAIRTGFETVS